MDLYFIDSNGKRELVARNLELGSAFSFLNNDLKKRRPDFQHYYTRYWETNDGYMIDYGSHFEFYALTKGEEENG